MKKRRIADRCAVTAGVGLAVLAVTAGLALSSASAAPLARPGSVSGVEAGELAADLRVALEGDAAGAYYDATTGRLVVNVVDGPDAVRVREAGAVARTVTYTLAQLDATRSELRRKVDIPGTSWAVNPKANKVVVTADRTVGDAGLARLTRAARGYGDKVEVRRSAGRFDRFLRDGDPIHTEDGRCSLGFNVVDGDGTPYFLTAGHCTDGSGAWSDARGRVIGDTAGSSFPGDDYGIVRYRPGVEHPSEVNLHDGSARSITRAADAYVGERVWRSGSTTGLHQGEVVDLDVTVQYPQGIVEGLIQTTVCAEPGDSGGSLFDGDAALGLTSGGSGDCSSGGETFFQPVAEPLAAYGVTIG
ncbi:S1 family peptidase [Streptomyces sp. LX-29]|uniref:S1 family peptidase n=1 Tax=Streptomyces sp. LX-29 TaxID=2900152 RepID=UPI00240E1FDB|nr:S1 family peptidase [Streptomyces sp. LX-29]WFB10285.1 S1 family peptidase [Streptomyces sp. LX-29]